ncbi:uroporphyrinogen-III synthase [Paraglaciecola aquimarina]|uniref:Uroporphyrinogen-III synthase n=1 Tax=Paraglaciecola algarum TaxID=3050085 RepID=A0ABS9DBJ2_9ALTE|nr:uroporphyrinogen-III synthase [Paraglaciecola sp. G1-23]MCF2949164.1 uroporphyrinogen-III synthase [Paraglaciecola sp. G1-23]
MSYLLLRPQAKCQASAKAFNQAGLNTIACGLIDTLVDDQAITKLPDKMAQLTKESNILVIVTSTVAAQQSVLLKQKWPANIQFFAVGASTAQILKSAAINVIVPQEPRTEGLLALPELNNVTNKTVIIMKGYGGRELLVESLKARGAQVQEWEVYKRQRVTQPLSTQDWHPEQIHCIIATSGEVIEAAFDYFELAWLIKQKWIVVSQRTAQIAAKLGVEQIKISKDASDQALIQCVQQL